jgi:hypothetical protein
MAAASAPEEHFLHLSAFLFLQNNKGEVFLWPAEQAKAIRGLGVKYFPQH